MRIQNSPLILLLSISFGLNSHAQQLPQFSQYINNHYLVNPASAGWEGNTNINLGGRMQWTGFDNAPKTSYLTFTSSSRKTTKTDYNPSIRISQKLDQKTTSISPAVQHGFGGIVSIDQFGSFRKMNIAGTYAVHIPISKTFRLSLGSKVGLTNYSFLSERGVTLTPELDNTYQNYISSGLNRSQLNLGAGIYLYNQNLFIGISADDLSRDFISFGNGILNFDTKIHTNIIAGYKIKVNDNFTITPAILAKVMRPSPFSIEPTFRFEFKEMIWAGISYRHSDAMVGMIGCTLSKRFKIGYSFDYSLSSLQSVNNGSHEVIIGIQLSTKKK